MFPRFLVVLTFCGWAGVAAAYCPPPPSHLSIGYSKPRKPVRPTPPLCVNTILKTHTCEDFQIQMYNSEIQSYNMQLDRYNNEVRNYIEELKIFVKKIEQYAICEINSLE
jgi:hypothetical protein